LIDTRTEYTSLVDHSVVGQMTGLQALSNAKCLSAKCLSAICFSPKRRGTALNKQWLDGSTDTGYKLVRFCLHCELAYNGLSYLCAGDSFQF
jgi:hypothetical protein